MKRTYQQHGITLVETLVATAVFALIAIILYATWTGMFTFVRSIRTKTVLTEIVSQRIEFIRNLQYGDVGTVHGIPQGVIPQVETVSRNGATYEFTTTVRNIDNPADGTLGGMPNDLSPADNKLVQITGVCTSCLSPTTVTYTSLIAPKNLETENGNGALVIKAINASGMPVSGATVTITNTALTPSVAITDVTDTDGVLTIVDAPPSTQQYKVVVTKDGYSTEQTYPFGAPENPNPTKPHLTVTANTISQDTFAVDQLSHVAFTALSPQCLPVVGVGATLTGTKLIGAPSLIKNTISMVTGGDGHSVNDAVDWDTYTVSIVDAVHHLVGLNTGGPLVVSPGSTQAITALLSTSSTNTLGITVSDTLGAPLNDAVVTINGSSLSGAHSTGSAYIEQSDWSAGPGHETVDSGAGFSSTDGGIEYDATPGLIQLRKADATTYVPAGVLVSSTIDLGQGGAPKEISWTPISQPSQAGTTPVRVQIAGSTDGQTWNFMGPDGTADTFYTTSTIPLTQIGSSRYLRYKIFLSTEDSTSTPRVTDVSVQYTNACAIAGQTSFDVLPNGTYTMTVSKSGFATSTKSITIPSTTYESLTLTAQ
jgi:Tfp pilus assembly protein PilE